MNGSFPPSNYMSQINGQTDIAIIGMTARFPGAVNLNKFWQKLATGSDQITEIPESRWNISDFYDPNPQAVNKSYSKWGGFLTDIDEFDPLFFNISPKEAELMCPEQRILLQESWKAFEDAGYSDKQLDGKSCSVFIGNSNNNEYKRKLKEAGIPADAYELMGNTSSILAARISYFLNLQGLNIAIDTACSSSLVATHLACESLRNGTSELALAGGITIFTDSDSYLLSSKAGMLSPEGKCKTFDDTANGFVPGEGVGLVVLKPLATAIEDGDRIYATIKGSGCNQDGKTNGITAPSLLAQAELECKVYQRFGINPNTISYVEAHGTGTKLGDPIEIEALTEAFEAYTDRKQFCAIGSVKTNIGHTLAAAGVAGLIKTALSLQYQKILPTLNCQKENNYIEFAETPFYVAQNLADWQVNQGQSRRAAVSSFGFSGTNAHLVLEEFVTPKVISRKEENYPYYFIPISAKTSSALLQKIKDLNLWLKSYGDRHELKDIAHTLLTGRSHFSFRCAIVAKNVRELQHELSNILTNKHSDKYFTDELGKPNLHVSKDMQAGNQIIDLLTTGDLSAREFKEKLISLVNYYLKSYKLQWQSLYNGNHCHISLPTYPFAKEKYWIPKLHDSDDTEADIELALSTKSLQPQPNTPVSLESTNKKEQLNDLREMKNSINIKLDLSQSEKPEADQKEMRFQVEQDLILLVHQILKIDPSQIKLHKNIRDYGFDSISLTQLTNAINERFNLSLMPPMLFEHQSLNSLIQFFLTEYQEQLVEFYANSAAVDDLAQEESQPITTDSYPISSNGVLAPPQNYKQEAIAVIGMSGMMPNSPDLATFWQNLWEGQDLISEIPEDRWNWQDIYGDALSGGNQTKVKWGGFMPEVDKFDPTFFGMSRREANLMDPQQRLFLETVWKTVENAGYKASDLAGSKTGLFVGVFSEDYSELLYKSGKAAEAHAVTGLTPSILANRISFLLDLRGPSVPVNTACSSSLIALHQAIEAIQSGSCSQAIVGGVNVMVSSTPFIATSKAGMLCEDGRCKTFDKRANGYVRGEGVGAVLLKPLSQAVADGDYIHGVIRGTAANHGGAANSLTSPNPEAQADVLVQAYQRAKIDPRRVNYIEAHGTGTSLGDPVEINGIKKAFGQLFAEHQLTMPQKPYCGIGTVKSSIGHLEAAAGIAGLIKVLLAMKQGKLHGNIHFQELNPYIQLEDSPFYLVTKNQDWQSLQDDLDRPLPRCAGISSFGFGGANAHVVVEEWLTPPTIVSQSSQPELIILSAKTEDRLNSLAANLLQFIDRTSKESGIANYNLANLAYTLQVGRMEMECRLALVVSDFQDLQQQLQEYCQGNFAPQKLLIGNLKQQKPDEQLFPGQKLDKDLLSDLIAQKELSKLAKLWIKGVEIDWTLLYSKEKKQRIPLPTYSFIRQRCWFGESEQPKLNRPLSQINHLPQPSFIKEKLSLSEGKGFTLQFHGDEFFIKDHVIAGNQLIPAAAIVEIARWAGEKTFEQKIIKVTEVTWTRPIAIASNSPALQIIFTTPSDSQQNESAFYISLADRKGSSGRFAEGKIQWTSTTSAAESINLDLISSRCQNTYNVKDVYQQLSERGIEYGKSFQGLSKLMSNQEEAFGHLEIPVSIPHDADRFYLHPSLLDAAFQTVTGYLNAHKTQANLLLIPFAVSEIELFAPLRSECYAHVLPANKHNPQSGIWTFDIAIADQAGRILVKIKEFNLRTVGLNTSSQQVVKNTKNHVSQPTLDPTTTDIHYYSSQWIKRSLLQDNPSHAVSTKAVTLVFAHDLDSINELATPDQENLVLVLAGDSYQQLEANIFQIRPRNGGDYRQLIIALQNEQKQIGKILHNWCLVSHQDRQNPSNWRVNWREQLFSGIYSIFHLSKALINLLNKQPLQLCLSFHNHHSHPLPQYAALSGLMKSIVMECSSISFKLVEFTSKTPNFDQSLLSTLWLECQSSDYPNRHVRYDANGRWEKEIVPLNLSHPEKQEDVKQKLLLRQGGNYWLTGGTGGLGLIVARFLAETYSANIVLSGRKELNDAIQTELDLLMELGGNAVYLQANVADKESMVKTMRSIKHQFGSLNGVFHCAGIVRDRFIENKNFGEFKSVLKPKVTGVMNLDEVNAKEELDFFAMFSSVTGVTGNPGQADYATGNAFMDCFATVRDQWVKNKLRFGLTLSINWPLWAEGGMQVKPEIEKLMLRLTGIEALATENGVEALKTALSSNLLEVIAVTGDKEKIDRFFQVSADELNTPPVKTEKKISESPVVMAANTSEPTEPSKQVNSQERFEKTEAYLVEIFAAALTVSPDEVDPHTPFQEYGIDSFIGLQLVNDLEKDFGTLSKTLLFENFCVRDLTNYFTQNYSEHLDVKFGLTSSSQTEVIDTAPNQIEPQQSNEEREADKDVTNPSPFIFLESDLIEYPDFRQQIEELVNRYGAESNALGRGNFAPYLFLEPNRKGFFYFNQVDKLLLAFGYVGSDEYLGTVLEYLEAYCEQNELQLNLIEEERLLNISQNAYSATAFGALQRVSDIRDFSLSGSKKRHLRHAISKFRKQGECHTVEYECGFEPKIDRSILEMIDCWSSQKVMINPYVERLKTEIEHGTLDTSYRFFLTYLQGNLQNVIIISPMFSHNGYLMDSEFYSSDMPHGGLEFTIVNIIEILKAEGYSCFSLGVTWGLELGDSSRAEIKVQKVLENLRDRNVFDGRGNFQFKNKFLPENSPIYLYRPLGSGADNVVDIILTIANSQHPQTSATFPQNKPSPDVAERSPVLPPQEFSLDYRSSQLQRQGFNPTNLDALEVEFDLATDSWFLLDEPWIEERLQQLAEKSHVSEDGERFLRHIFPFAYLLPVESGKAAESCFCQAFTQDKKIVLQNLLFPSMIYNEISNGFVPQEIPGAEVYCLNSDDKYRGNIDLQQLQEFLTERSDEVAFVCVEVGNNAAGGQPVSLENLKKVKALTLSYDVSLVIDATRIVENAVFNANESGSAANQNTNQNIWNFVRQICTYADVLTASLTKDFGVKQGGLIATNNGELFEKIQAYARQDNLELSPSNQTLLGKAFQDLPWIETKVQQRMEQVKIINAAFKDCGFPVATPNGGHCILIDVLKIPEFARLKYPQASFLAWLYQYGGIRGGIHCTGMGKNPPLDGVIRLAVPIGLSFQEAKTIAARVQQLDYHTNPILQLEMESKPATIGGEARAEFRLQTPESRQFITESKPPKNDLPSAKEADRESSVDSREVSVKDIAIIGVSGRYPMADNIEEFWDNLAVGKNCITERPLGRWGENLPPNHEQVPKTRWGGFINNVDKFDSIFFSISPREAELLDPQERLFLEVAWESLEDAGYHPDNLPYDQSSRNVGVFVGAVWQLYQLLGVEEIHKGNVQTPNSLMWNIANRVSSFMNFNGPSLTVDTACSGALAAIHLACQSIYNGDCQAAIAGGVNLDLHALKWLLTEAGGFLSEHGRCKAFGEDAQGYVAGEGVGAILLKPLDRAIADGDRIYATIKSCVFNHGGRASGYTVPNPNAQADLIASAIHQAGIDARTIGYIEAHGTGTKLGDPVEIQGLTQAFRESTAENQFCSLGSVKSNIGHLEAAAGIAGLTKVLLQLKHQKLVPSLHASNPNSFIDFANSPFYIQQKLTDWQPITIDGVTYPRRAGVSSFGAGGSNLHIILEEYQNPHNSQPQKEDDHRQELILLSARNEQQLRDYACRMQQFLSKDLSQELSQQEHLRDIAFTLQVGRKPMRKRLAIVATSKEMLLDKLNCFLAHKERVEGVFTGDIKNSQKDDNVSCADITTWVQNRNYYQLASDWTRGLIENLESFMTEAEGRRISLPTYPFAKVRHWLTVVEEAKVSPKFPPKTYNQSLHPLIDSNESTLEKVTFQKLIDPQQYVFRDHVVASYPTLPGVAYIEMGCVAGTLAAQKSVRVIKSLVWAAPINLESPPQINIDVKPSQKDIRFEVFTLESSNQKVVHAQGKLGYEELSQPQPLDLETIRQRCSHFTSKQQCYEMLGSLQFNYGTCLQAIAEVQHNSVEGLTKLVLPEPLHQEFSNYHLHPSLMDGAVQSIIAVMQNESGYVQTPYLPFVVGEVEIFQPLTQVCYSHITIRKSNRDIDTIKKVDVTIVDEQGEVLVRMNDFALKAFNLDDLDASSTDRQEDSNTSSNGVRSTPIQESPARIYVSSVWEEDRV